MVRSLKQVFALNSISDGQTCARTYNYLSLQAVDI